MAASEAIPFPTLGEPDSPAFIQRLSPPPVTDERLSTPPPVTDKRLSTPPPVKLVRTDSCEKTGRLTPPRPTLRTRSESIISQIADPLTAQASDIFSASSASPRASPRTFPVRPTRKLYAIGDIHLSFKPNRIAWEELRPHPLDGLILVGDVGETKEHCELAFIKAKACFHTVFWCPGNHELYTLASQKDGARGVAKYEECVEMARHHGVITPEDPYTIWDGDGGPCLIAPTFTLYDYSFKPDDVSVENAVEWAKEQDILATDEMLLHPDPYSSRQEWCAALIEKEEAKLQAAVEANPDTPLVIINHWPLRKDLVRLTLVPRFIIWCGSTKTDEWHKRFNAKVVVSGHLHVRRTDWKDETRFEECSLGYPKQWREAKELGKDINDMLREILPGPEMPPGAEKTTIWRRTG